MANYYYEYDAFANRLYESGLELQLAPYESKVFIASDTKLETNRKPDLAKMKSQNLNLNWKVSFAEALKYPQFKYLLDLRELEDLRKIHELEKSTGTVRYEAQCPFMESEKQVVLELEQVWEIEEVFINGVSAGAKICGPSQAHFLIDKEENNKKGQVEK